MGQTEKEIEYSSFHQYFIGSNGDIRNSKKSLRPYKDRDGYWRIELVIQGKRKTFKVHRLVATSFHGDGMGLTVNHIDGNKDNNCRSNLELVTQSENSKHAFRINLNRIGKGELSRSNKLDDIAVLAIRTFKDVKLDKCFADQFGVTRKNISLIRRGKTWQHLPL
jgi:hypothetical protein